MVYTKHITVYKLKHLRLAKDSVEKAEKTFDTKRIYMINAGMYSWITDGGMWTNYKGAFPNALAIPLYQSQLENSIVKIFRNSSRSLREFFVSNHKRSEITNSNVK